MANRYQELLAAIPKGRYYASQGDVLPKRDSPYEFRFETSTPSTRFGVFVNGVFRSITDTDGAGVALVSVELEAGEQLIALVNEGTQQVFRSYVTIRSYATWLAAQADVYASIDTKNAALRQSLSIPTSSSLVIADAYGRRLRQPNDANYLLEAYRNVIQEQWQAYRLWAARPAGIRQVVHAITSVNPLRIPRAWKPQWFLDDQLLATGTDLRDISVLVDDGTLALLNSQVPIFVRGTFLDNLAIVPGPFNNPPTAQPLTVTFNAGWVAGAAGDVVITGLDSSGNVITDTFLKPGVASTVFGVTGQFFATVTDIRPTATGAGAGSATVGLATSRFVQILAVRGPTTVNGGSSSHNITHVRLSPFDSLQLDSGPTVYLPFTGAYTLYGAIGYDGDARIDGVAVVAPAGGTVSYGLRDRLWVRVDNNAVVKCILAASPATLASVAARVNEAIAREESLGATRATGSISGISSLAFNEGDTITITDGLGFSATFEADTNNTVTAGNIPFLRTGSAFAIQQALLARINDAGILTSAFPLGVGAIDLISELGGTSSNVAITSVGTTAVISGMSGGLDASAEFLNRASSVSNGVGDILSIKGGDNTTDGDNAIEIDPSPVDASLDVMGFPRIRTRLNSAYSELTTELDCSLDGTLRFPELPAIVLHASLASSILATSSGFTQPDFAAPLEVWFSAEYNGGDIIADGLDCTDAQLSETFAYPGKSIVDSGAAGLNPRQLGGRAANAPGTLATVLIGTADGPTAEVAVYNNIAAGSPGNVYDAVVVFIPAPNLPLIVTLGGTTLTVILGTNAFSAPDPTQNTGIQIANTIEFFTGLLAAPTGTGLGAISTAQPSTPFGGGADDASVVFLTPRPGRPRELAFLSAVRPGMILRILSGSLSFQTRRIAYVSMGNRAGFPAAYLTQRGLTSAYPPDVLEVGLVSAFATSFMNVDWEVVEPTIARGESVFRSVSGLVNTTAGSAGRYQLRIRDGVLDYGIPTRIGRGVRTSGVDGVLTPSAAKDTATFTSASWLPDPYDFEGILRISGSAAWAGANNGIHSVCRLDPAAIDLTPGVALIKHEWWTWSGRFQQRPNTPTDWSSFADDDNLTWSMYSTGEVVTVIGNDRGTGTLTIAEPGLIRAKANFDRVEDAAGLPVMRDGLERGIAEVDVAVDLALRPLPTTTIQPVGFQERALPDRWRTWNIDESLTIIDAWGHTNELHMRLESDGGAVLGGGMIVEVDVPRALDYKGFILRITWWVEQMISASEDFVLEVSFDGGVTFSTTAPTAVGLSITDAGIDGLGGTNPTPVTTDIEVPTDAVSCIVRLRHDAVSAAGDRIFLEKVQITATLAQGLFLESNTIARHETHAQFGEILYVWSPEDLEAAEELTLGVPDAASHAATVDAPGHIDRVTNAHGYWERSDVSEYDASDPVNVRGAYNELAWMTATLTNMTLVPLVPGRMSYVRPTIPSLLEAEKLEIVAPSNATLPSTSRHEGIFPQVAELGDRLLQGEATTVLQGTTAASLDGLTVTITAGTFTGLQAGDIFRPGTGGSARIARNPTGQTLTLTHSIGPFDSTTWEAIRTNREQVPVPDTSFPGTHATATIGAYLGANGTIVITADDPGLGPQNFTVTVNASLATTRPMRVLRNAATGAITIELAVRDGALVAPDNRALIVASAIDALDEVSATHLPGTGASALTTAEGPTSFTSAQATPWRFLSATEVQLASLAAGDPSTVAFYREGVLAITTSTPVYDTASEYRVDYEQLLRAETIAIDLGVDFADYLWLIDAAIFRRTEPELLQREHSANVLMRSDFTATLDQPAVQDQTLGRLTRDTGIVRTEIPVADWSFVDARTIKLNPAQFLEEAVFVLEYTAESARFPRVADFVLEAKSATSIPGLSAAIYEEVAIDQPVGRPNGLAPRRYFQLRITITGVVDTRDIRVKSLGLKGIHLRGDAHAPGLITCDEE